MKNNYFNKEVCAQLKSFAYFFFVFLNLTSNMATIRLKQYWKKKKNHVLIVIFLLLSIYCTLTGRNFRCMKKLILEFMSKFYFHYEKILCINILYNIPIIPTNHLSKSTTRNSFGEKLKLLKFFSKIVWFFK